MNRNQEQDSNKTYFSHFKLRKVFDSDGILHIFLYEETKTNPIAILSRTEAIELIEKMKSMISSQTEET